MNRPATASFPKLGLRILLNLFTGVAIAAVASIVVLSLWGKTLTENAAERSFVGKDVTADILPPPMYLVELRLVLSQAAEGSLPIEKARSEAARLTEEYQTRVRFWKQNPPFGLEAHLLGAQHEAGLRFIEASQAVLAALVAGGDAASIKAAMATAHAAYLTHRAGVDETVKASNAFAQTALDDFQANKARVWWAQAIGLALSTCVLLIIAVWVRRSIWSAVGGEPSVAAAVAHAVASGDLSVPVPVMAGDERSILAAMARMRTSLSGLVNQVRVNSDNIAVASEELAQGVLDLSVRTEQQAGALQQTASTMDELAVTLGHNVDHSKQADQLAVGASDVAIQGGDVVGQVVQTMKGINESSKKIAEIIGVIDGIAFQTNILALNAAVEAARAGEQGRGFAVVAGEVRTLAQRSAEAAREIKTLIHASVERVNQGTDLVDRAGRTIQDIVVAIRRVTDIVGEMSAASGAQTTGVAQIGQAIVQMDETTQQNAALVEQSSAAATSLSRQAVQLVQAVAAFKLATH